MASSMASERVPFIVQVPEFAGALRLPDGKVLYRGAVVDGPSRPPTPPPSTPSARKRKPKKKKKTTG